MTTADGIVSGDGAVWELVWQLIFLVAALALALVVSVACGERKGGGTRRENDGD